MSTQRTYYCRKLPHVPHYASDRADSQNCAFVTALGRTETDSQEVGVAVLGQTNTNTDELSPAGWVGSTAGKEWGGGTMERKRSGRHLELCQQVIFIDICRGSDGLPHCCIDLLHVIILLVDVGQHLVHVVHLPPHQPEVSHTTIQHLPC